MENSTLPWIIDSRTGVEVRFCDIDPVSKKIGSALTRLGFKKGDFLHFVTYETGQLYLIQLGIWRIGGAVRGSFQDEAAGEYARQISESRARFVLADVETLPKVREAVASLDWKITIIVFSDDPVENAITVNSLLQDDGSAFPSKVEFDPDNDIFGVANTSGSTGLPKGVVETHKSAVALINRRECMPFFDYSIMTPMNNFPQGVYTVTTGSIANAVQVIHLGKFERDQYFDMLLKYKPGTVVMYPFVATWFARHEKLDQVDLSFLKVILSGGAIIDSTTMSILLKKLPHVSVRQMYGQTECPGIVNTEEHPVMTELEGKTYVSSGKLTPYVSAKIVDINTKEPLGPYKIGEITTKSIITMKGYLSKDSPTPIRPNIDSEGWLSTGDAGFFDDKGNLFITERLGFVFKYIMYFVSPSEIESVLQQHEKVFEVGVIGVPNPETTNLARAFVVKKGDVSEKELCDFVAQKLPVYKHLHGGVRFVEKLPVGRTGKLDRAELKKIAIELN